MQSQVQIGDYISDDVHRDQDNTTEATMPQVISVTVAMINPNQNRDIATTVVTTNGTFTFQESDLTLSYKNDQGQSVWFIQQ